MLHRLCIPFQIQLPALHCDSPERHSTVPGQHPAWPHQPAALGCPHTWRSPHCPSDQQSPCKAPRQGSPGSMPACSNRYLSHVRMSACLFLMQFDTQRSLVTYHALRLDHLPVYCDGKGRYHTPARCFHLGTMTVAIYCASACIREREGAPYSTHTQLARMQRPAPHSSAALAVIAGLCRLRMWHAEARLQGDSSP